MLKVNIFSAEEVGIYESFLTPLYINRQLLKKIGLTFRIFHKEDDHPHEADCTIVMSLIGRTWWKGISGEERTEKTFVLLEKLKQRVDKVFWFDCSDSSGSNQFRFLPYVDKFLKPYLLKDRSLYQRQYYRDRIYTDYYHTHYGINEVKESPLRILPCDSDLPKIQPAWSSALGDFGHWNPYLRKLRQTLPFPAFYSARFTTPEHNRTINVNMRFSTSYNRETVAYQRQLVQQKAVKLRIPFGRIPRRQYLRELKNSRIAVSPYGWGEVCFRDYEAILSGCLLLKPDMTHMTTWPDLYVAGKTYMPFKWDCSDLENVIDESLWGQKCIEIAREAQKVYRKYLFGKEGKEEFCRRFLNIVER